MQEATWNQTVALGSRVEEDGRVIVMWEIFLYAANVLLLLVDELSCFDLWKVKIKVGKKAKTEYTEREDTVERDANRR